MRISVIGCGYLGAVHAAGLAALGHDVVGIDVDATRSRARRPGEAPFYEPGLRELLAVGAGLAALHHRPGGRRGLHGALRLRRHAAAAAARTPRTSATSRPRSRRCCPTCAPATWSSASPRCRSAPLSGLLAEVPRGLPGRHAGVEPGVPARGPRGPRHPAPRPAGDRAGRGRRRATTPGRCCARSTPAPRRGRPRSSRPTWPPRSWSRSPPTPSWPPRSPSSTRWPRSARPPAATSYGLADAIGHDTRIGPQFLQRRARLRRWLPAQGHPGVHGPRRRARRRPGAGLPPRGRRDQPAPPGADGRPGPRGVPGLDRRAPDRGPRRVRSSPTATTSATRPALSVAAQMSLQGAEVVVTDPQAIDNARPPLAGPEVRLHRRGGRHRRRPGAAAHRVARVRRPRPRRARRRWSAPGGCSTGATPWTPIAGEAAGWTYRALGRPMSDTRPA